MGVKCFFTDFNRIWAQEFLRMDFWYRQFFDINKAISYKINSKQIPLKMALKPINWWKVSKWELEDEECLIDMCNVERRMNNLVDLEIVNEIGSDKNILQEWDIVIPKLQPRMWNLFLNTNHERYLASSEFVEYKISNQNPMFLYYLLTSNTIANSLKLLESWKTHRRVSPNDLLKVKIPDISREIQEEKIEEIRPLEQKIKQLKSTIKPIQDTINEVFSRELWFDLIKYNNSNFKYFYTPYTRLVKDNLLRNSYHANDPKLIIIEEKTLDKTRWEKVSDVFDISWWKRMPKWEIYPEEETWYKYLRPAEVDIFWIKTEEVKNISQKVRKELLRYNIKTWEFCISIVGTLWKTAYVNTEQLGIEDENLILSENFVKLKLKEHRSIIPNFYYYYFYSFIFEWEINREYTITSIKKLWIDKRDNIHLPKFSLAEQERIVEEIQTEIHKQDKVRKEIQQERNKIDEIIESVILSDE